MVDCRPGLDLGADYSVPPRPPITLTANRVTGMAGPLIRNGNTTIKHMFNQ